MRHLDPMFRKAWRCHTERVPVAALGEGVIHCPTASHIAHSLLPGRRGHGARTRVPTSTWWSSLGKRLGEGLTVQNLGMLSFLGTPGR
jgi:hypothetical protein